MMIVRWLLMLLLCCAAATPAVADELRPGYLALTQRTTTQWYMVWKAPVAGGFSAQTAPILPTFCVTGTPERSLEQGSLKVVWNVTCAHALAGEQVGLSGLDTGFSDALVRIAQLNRPVQAARLTANAPTLRVEERASRTQVAQTYLMLGIQHILGGYDHFLFVLALVLLLQGGWTTAKTVTAFTVAHSITLAGATLGFLGVAQKPVEICIALSIMFLAVEVAKRDPDHPRLAERAPWVIAFLFGLLHGFGFAGALADIGMPDGEVPVALLTFNLGVEAGQLLIVGAAVTVLTLITRYTLIGSRPVRAACAYAIGITSAVWLMERTLA